MTASFSRRLAALTLVAFGLAALQTAQAADLTVSAAASLTNAFRELGTTYEAQHPGTKVLLNFAASDALLAQIAKGAPVDVFASADLETMDKAEAQKLMAPGTRQVFVHNALVVVTPSEGALPLKALTDLQKPEVKRIALGKPEGVPAGRYAQTALQAAQLWTVVEAKAVYAANVRQALDYVARGEVEAGFVYATDAAAQKDKVRIAFEVPTTTPISYPIAAVAGGPNPQDARQFIALALSPEGQAILAKYGFKK
ncbi:MAG TPA: molybdate ABC transporter substrate-binding protein [Burkholderiaceae bacterium]|jgi:molybdate transport system substrate-binding protein